MSESDEIRVILELEDGYAFRVSFAGTGLDALHTDEPPPLGAGEGPNPSRLLLAAIANCLSASLLFAMRKFHNRPEALQAIASARLERNAEGRWRIPRANVELQLGEAVESHQQMERILAQFEQFCVVTQSVRQGIEVDVSIRDAGGRLVLAGPDRKLDA